MGFGTLSPKCRQPGRARNSLARISGACKPHHFVSALDAEIYRLAAHTAGETTWRRCEIEQIDMRPMALILGGELWFQMVFGFCADHAEQLLLSDGLHQLLFVPLHFDIHVKPIHPLTFHFNDPDWKHHSVHQPARLTQMTGSVAYSLPWL